MERPIFEAVKGVGKDGMAKDKEGRIWLGVESHGESDLDWLGKCGICGEKIYIGWKRFGNKALVCFDCPLVLTEAGILL